MIATTSKGYDRARAKVEKGFARWGEICFDHPWWIIGLVSVAVLFFSTFLPNMVVDTSTEGYLHPDDPARLVYDEFQRQFSRDERIVVVVESDTGITNDAFLKKLQTLHHALEQIPQVDKVDSLINARLTTGREDELIVRDLLEDWPQSRQDFERLHDTIKRNPVYQKQFVNPTMTQTLLIVTPDTYTANKARNPAQAKLEDFDFEAGFSDGIPTPADAVADSNAHDDEPGADKKGKFITGEEVFGIVDAIVAIKDAQETSGFKIGLAGSPYIMQQMTYVLGMDMFVFSAIGIVLISLLLLAIFRRWVMVILPISVAALSLYFTIVMMVVFDLPVTTSVQILPSLLLAVGVSNTVHLFTVFYQAIDRGLDKRASLSYALGHSGLAVVMTGLTTAGGLVSFITADIKPVADIGIICPMGIVNTLLFSLVLLPALIAVSPLAQREPKDNSGSLAQRFLAGCADISTRYPRSMVAIWLLFLGLCLIPASQIKPSHYPLIWFQPDNEVRTTTEMLDREFGGSAYMEIVIDTKKANGLHDPELLQATDRALQFAAGLEVGGVKMGKATSLLDINKELHQALHANDPAYYKIPDQRELVAQELLLFENSGSDDLVDIVDTSFSKMRITVAMPFVDSTLYPAYLDVMEPGFREIIGDRAEVTFTGIINLLTRTVKVLIGDTIRSYLLAFLIIAPLMMLLVGSVRTGLVSMIPNLAPVIVILAMMYFVGIPLDAFTLLVGSITLGLAVDDTIHFMHNFQRYYAVYRDSRRAVQETLRTTGEAMLITSLVLTVAFFVNLFGSMINLQHFGLLTGSCIIVALFADLLLAPALMTLLIRYKEQSA